MRRILRFFLFIEDGKLAISARRKGQTLHGLIPGSKELLLSFCLPHSLNATLHLPHYHFSAFAWCSSRRFVADLPHHAVAFPLLLLPPVPTSPIYHSLSFCLTRVLGRPCASWSLCCKVPLCLLTLILTAVSLCRRSGGPGLRRKGVGNPLPTPLSYSAENLDLGRVTSQNKQTKKPPKEVVFGGVCF